MNNELKKLELILSNFPMSSNRDQCEFSLENIPTEDAVLVWKYAQKYLSIAKEVDVV